MFQKGSTIQLSITVNDDITDWKIRAEIFDDDSTSIKLATFNSGGSDNQIEKTSISATSSIFVLKFASGLTDNINDVGYLEIEADTGIDVGGAEEILTILPKMTLSFEKSQIDWTAP